MNPRASVVEVNFHHAHCTSGEAKLCKRHATRSPTEFSGRRSSQGQEHRYEDHGRRLDLPAKSAARLLPLCEFPA
jgi:hypothetical protein